MEREARRWMEREARYRWLGPLPREKALGWLARSSLTLNTSHSEGASNVVLEAVRLGVPILASRVEGNVGLLGPDYDGLFDGEEELTGLMRGAELLLGRLRSQLSKRAPLFEQEHEQRLWNGLVRRVLRGSVNQDQKVPE